MRPTTETGVPAVGAELGVTVGVGLGVAVGAGLGVAVGVEVSEVLPPPPQPARMALHKAESRNRFN